jgi:DtxR family transcriptional regulator, manganese transport regulator
MALANKKSTTAKLRSAAFKRVRADHSAELAGDYVEMIADLIDERGEARCTDSRIRAWSHKNLTARYF